MKPKVISLEKVKKAREEGKKKPRKRRIRLKRLLMSGLTTRDFLFELNTRHEQPPDRCYICRRQQGDEGVYFRQDGEPSIAGMRLALHSVRLSDELEFNFLICQECAVLLGACRNPLEEK